MSDAPEDPEPPVLDDDMVPGETRQVEYDGKPVSIQFFGNYSIMTDVVETES